jgi:four helix bundle protein
MRDYKSLIVWQKSHALTLAVDAVCVRMPRERGTLRSQMRRAAESVTTNIVEGCSRRTQKELAAFLQISVGSSGELEYQLQLAHDYGTLPTAAWNELRDQTIEVRRMLCGLIKRVRAADKAAATG